MVDVVAWALRFLRFQPATDHTHLYFVLEAATGTSAVISNLADE
jgi:hypothetical protein